jgi:hypothetical protein
MTFREFHLAVLSIVTLALHPNADGLSYLLTLATNFWQKYMGNLPGDTAENGP